MTMKFYGIVGNLDGYDPETLCCEAASDEEAVDKFIHGIQLAYSTVSEVYIKAVFESDTPIHQVPQ